MPSWGIHLATAKKVLEKIIANSPTATVEDLIKQALKVL